MSRLVSAAEIQPRGVAWLWRGYVALGKVTVLDGRPGLGKSAMTLDVAARVSRGASMPDGTPGVRPANVILVTAEDDWADTVVPRLMAANADLGRIFRLDELVLPDGCTVLEAMVLEKTALLV